MENQLAEQSNENNIEFNSNSKLDIKKEDSTETMISKLHQAAILAQVKNDDDTNRKFIEQAKKTVDNELDTLDKKNIVKRQEATYNANKEACKCYGIEDAVPLWQIRLMRIGHSIWFVIYWIFATITICPINVFVTGINAFIKRTWLSIIVALIIYLSFAVLIPLLITLRK